MVGYLYLYFATEFQKGHSERTKQALVTARSGGERIWRCYSFVDTECQGELMNHTSE